MGYRSWAELELPEMIIEADRRDLFPEATRCLERYRDRGDPFPSTRFRALVAAARLAERMGDPRAAAAMAAAALQLVGEMNTAPFPRHPTVGLIEADESTLNELRRIAKT